MWHHFHERGVEIGSCFYTRDGGVMANETISIGGQWEVGGWRLGGRWGFSATKRSCSEFGGREENEKLGLKIDVLQSNSWCHMRGMGSFS